VLHICTSHRTESLLDAFVQSMQDERTRLGAFSPIHLVVPNRNIEAYLRLRLAERCGIAANLDTRFLRAFLTSIAERAVPGARVAGLAAVHGHVLALLHDADVLAAPELAPVAGYLATAGSDRDALDRRRCQLAGNLARLFDEYAGSRPDMLGEWATDRAQATGATTAPELAVWQRTLWRAVFGPGGRLERETLATGVRRVALATLWAEAMAQSTTAFAGNTLHVFGLSYMAVAYQRMLAALGRRADVRLYTLSPCREDADALVRSIASDGERIDRVAGEDPFRLSDEAHPILRLWARPGRESLRLLAGLDDTTADLRFDAPAGSDSLLGRLQADIVARRIPSQITVALDDSVRVLPCPSLRRELEVVAAEIWALARRDPTLRLCDVAVVVPEASKDLYLAQVRAVFGESSDLPHNIADLPDPAAGRVGQAIAMLLDLPFSSFSRKELLPLLTHPCVLGALPEATPEAMRALVSSLGIVLGAERADLADTYLDRDLLTWEQGLKRLALGALADHAGLDSEMPFVLDGESYLPGPPPDGDIDARFGLLVRSLVSDARFAAGRGSTPERPLPEWLAFIRAMLATYLTLDKDDGAGKSALSAFLAGLDEIEEGGLHDVRISYRVAAELARGALDRLPQGHGHYLAGGVTVASFVPMRAIPFRAVFVLGLGQQTFPRPPQRHELDLRRGQRRAGDVDSREQDLYMFLETLLSAREHLVLSYVARDEITGDELPASSVLHDLRRLLAQSYLTPADCARLYGDDPRTRPPLRRFDDDQRRGVLPAAEEEHRARALGRDLVQSGAGLQTAWARLAHLDPPIRAGVARLLALPDLSGATPVDRPETVAIPIIALSRFLVDPLQGAARFHLRLRENDEAGLTDVEDEPFDLDRLVRWRLLCGSAESSILAAQAAPDADALVELYRRRALAAELNGETPIGLFRRPIRAQEETVLRGWQAELVRVLGRARVEARTFHFSPTHERDDDRAGTVVRVRSPSLHVAVPGGRAHEPERSVEVAITGETRLWATCPGQEHLALAFSTGAHDGKRPKRQRVLRAFLDYLALAASGNALARTGAHCAHFFLSDGAPAVETVMFRPVEPERARAYLTGLCVELLTGARDDGGAPTGMHPYLLPHEAVLAGGRDIDGVLQQIAGLCREARGGRSSFSSMQGALPDVLDRYAAPDAREVARMVDARFGLYFDLVAEQVNDRAMDQTVAQFDGQAEDGDA
jgi:exodeoxyribonuclease V gamma subunit